MKKNYVHVLNPNPLPKSNHKRFIEYWNKTFKELK